VLLALLVSTVNINSLIARRIRIVNAQLALTVEAQRKFLRKQNVRPPLMPIVMIVKSALPAVTKVLHAARQEIVNAKIVPIAVLELSWSNSALERRTQFAKLAVPAPMVITSLKPAPPLPTLSALLARIVALEPMRAPAATRILTHNARPALPALLGSIN